MVLPQIWLSQAQRPSVMSPVERCRSAWGPQTGSAISECIIHTMLLPTHSLPQEGTGKLLIIAI